MTGIMKWIGCQADRTGLCKGTRGLRPWTVVSAAEIRDGCGKGGIKKYETSDPHFLKQRAQRPQEVHLNSLSTGASKCASKLQEDCIFKDCFSFILQFKSLSQDVLCARLLYQSTVRQCVREIVMKEKEQLEKKCAEPQLIGPSNTGMFSERCTNGLLTN